MTSECLFYNSKLTLYNSVDSAAGLANEPGFIAWRDSSWGNALIRDTVRVVDGGSHAGTVPLEIATGGLSQTCHDFVVDSSLFSTCRANAFVGKDVLRSLQFHNTTFASRAGLAFVNLDYPLGPDLLMRHVTLYSGGAHAVEDAPSASAYSINAAGCITYSRLSSGTCNQQAVLVGLRTTDFGDSSLFFRSSGAGTSDSSHYAYDAGYCVTSSAAGARWFEPEFADTSWDSLDLRPSPCSYATMRGFWPDNYVGALTGTPGAASDLACEQGKLTVGLSWTWPCDGGATATYQLRRSISAIANEAQFQASTVVDSGDAGAPGTSGCLTATGLGSCTTYYFALRLANHGVSGAISNAPSVTTKCSGAEPLFCGEARRLPPDGGQRTHLLVPAIVSVRDHSVRIRVGFGSVEVGRVYEVDLFDVAGRRVGRAGRGVALGSRDSSEDDLALELPRGMRPGVAFVRLRVGAVAMARMVVFTP